MRCGSSSGTSPDSKCCVIAGGPLGTVYFVSTADGLPFSYKSTSVATYFHIGPVRVWGIPRPSRERSRPSASSWFFVFTLENVSTPYHPTNARTSVLSIVYNYNLPTHKSLRCVLVHRIRNIRRLRRLPPFAV